MTFASRCPPWRCIVPTPRRYANEAERKRAYRLRKKAEAAAAAAQPQQTGDDDPPVSAPMAAVLSTNPSLTVLESIRDNQKALDSDRIRASTEITKIQALERESRRGTSDLVDLRAIIEALPVGERLAYLKGEVDEHRAAAAGAYTPDEEEDA